MCEDALGGMTVDVHPRVRVGAGSILSRLMNGVQERGRETYNGLPGMASL